MKTVLVTGASGFIGSILCKRLSENGFKVKAVYRPSAKTIPEYVNPVFVDSIDKDTQWKQILEDVSIVIHAAARVHMMKDSSENPLEEYRKINYYGTVKLAEEAIKNGVQLFIHLSTAKVAGDGKKSSYKESDPEMPMDPYGVSKLESERKLMELSRESCMRVVNLRLPLVYGPGVKANFLNLMNLVKKKLPLPLKKIDNKRSLLYVENLCHAILTLIDNDSRLSSVYYLSDNSDISSEELVRKIAHAMECKICLFFIPLPLMLFIAKLTGKTKVLDRLAGSFTVDASKFRNELNWDPPYSMDIGLKETVKWFKHKKS